MKLVVLISDVQIFFHFESNQILGLESNKLCHSQKAPLISTC